MTETGKIGSILPGKIPALSINGTADAESIGPGSFAEMLAEGIQNVQDLEAESDRLQVDLALGRPVELHQVMLAATKAQIAMEMLIEMRNRLIEAYQEISRMAI
jgi:flagellar hook-basal body complex protein FliE